MGFDVAFGGYSDVPPTMGRLLAERLIASNLIDPVTGLIGNHPSIHLIDSFS